MFNEGSRNEQAVPINGDNIGLPPLWSLPTSSRNPIFSQIFGHQRAKNEARNTKMNRGQETHPLRVNARYVMNGTNSFLKKFRKPIFSQIFGHQRAKNEARNRKMNTSQETQPIRINARYEMNWANSFSKKFRKPHFRPNIWPPESRKWD